MKKKFYLLGLIVLITILLLVVFNDKKEDPLISRNDKIPLDAIKITPKTDLNPPKSLYDEYHDPVPLPYPINTAGGEDSAFIMPDGNTLYFWFTPDVNAPISKQLHDGVTGIYVSYKSGNIWGEPKRVWLNEPGELSFDGCVYMSEDNIIWTCAVREGYNCPDYSGGMCWFKAELDLTKKIGKNPERVNFSDEWEVGELHIHEDKLYYHSKRPGGKGGLDIWVLTLDSSGSWSNPKNLNINTERDEGFPAISPDGTELWFSRDYALWRSKKMNDVWSEPEKMFSPLAGEASIDKYGNIYFTHHFFEGDRMIEADIYVSYKK
ncbi:MAG: hypothetical protein GF365_00975 [Candidatus Buchananbacteria bacterium]|nr:hypothetical protein [Candidatus Buchananbacteria bacterium]